jgi:hypothetical protein
VKPPPEQLARQKPLETTVGMIPSAPDFGAEADLVSTINKLRPPALTRRWNYALKGWIRAPMRVSLGPRNDGTEGSELHSPPRVVGGTPDRWDFIGLAPNPQAALHVMVQNVRISANLLIVANGFNDSGYDNFLQTGGLEQAYVTLKFPEVFGKYGGLAWTIGGFSNRYGVAGPSQKSTGYYGAYLFGRTHVAGEAVTADIDLSDDVELVLEHGIGAKLEVVPWIAPNNVNLPPPYPYLPSQGPVPQGSNFVHHAHAALVVDDWIRIAGHYLYSWTPNDMIENLTTNERPKAGKLTVVGGEVHIDHPVAGNAYLGYSRMIAKRILPLADGVELLHGVNGYGIKQNYFGRTIQYDAVGRVVPGTEFDSGDVDTVLFQYMVKAAPILGWDLDGPDVGLAIFGMTNHVVADVMKADRVKVGAELGGTPFKHLWITVRGDHVMRAPFGHATPGHPDQEFSYSAISPRIIIHTTWISREYVVLSYSHFFLGKHAAASPPYENLAEPDPELVVLSANVAF